MDYSVRVEVEIESENSDFNTTVQIVEMIFTSYETIFDFEVTKYKLEKALKYIKNDFKLLTIQSYSYRMNEFHAGTNNHIIGRRYANQYGEIKRAVSSDNHYNHWNGVDFKNLKKQLFEDLKECINVANRHFISLVKTENILINKDFLSSLPQH